MSRLFCLLLLLVYKQGAFITDIPTAGLLSLAVVPDLFSHMAVSWAMAPTEDGQAFSSWEPPMYGLIEEGFALQTIYAAVALWAARILGVNGVYTAIVITWIHPVWRGLLMVIFLLWLSVQMRRRESIATTTS